MAEIVMTLASPVVKLALEKLISFATPEVLAFRDFKKDIDTLKKSLEEIQDLLTDFEKKQLKSFDRHHMKGWSERLQAAAHDAEDLISIWSTEYHLWDMTSKVHRFQRPFSASNPIFKNCHSHKLRDTVAELNELLKEGNHRGERYTNITGNLMPETEIPSPQGPTSLPDSHDSFFARDEVKEKIIQELISDEEASDGENVSFISILGMGGVGKTTLAQRVYRDDRVKGLFKYTIWICVTNFDVPKILKEMLVALTLQNTDLLSNDLQESRVLEEVSKYRTFVVLDDLWNDNYPLWEKLAKVLSRGARGNRVLVTSRVERVSRMIGANSSHPLQGLDDGALWLLLKAVAFGKTANATATVPDHLQELGKEIVKKCKGLPLAAKQMGGVLRGNTDANVWRNIARSEIWEVEDDDVLPALRLSYNQLPSHLKQCFAYCSLFPKGYVYDVNESVKLWMAEAFIQPKNRQRTEETGSGYFKELSDRFFFESSSEDDKTKYLMHDLIHDLAQSISCPFYCQVKDTDQPGKAPIFGGKPRHVSLLSKEVEQPTLEIIRELKGLRTLLFPVQNLRAFGKAQNKIFESLKYMRVLDMSSSTLQILPDSIENLKLLHYLDLSKTEIKKFPDSMCKLYNLETLKLLGCPWLFSLPRNLSKLVKLRHLELDDMFWYKVSTFPPSIGRLTGLHNLHKFEVGCTTGYKLEELQNMAYLTRTLHISKLENAVDAGKANLKEKEMIQKVVYEWSNGDLNLQNEATGKQVLEDLQPQPNITQLQICGYRGNKFPIWMQGGRLQNLVNIYLNGCTRSRILSLGKLPNLRECRLKNMLALEEWREEEHPSLGRLEISGCPELTKLPWFFPNLRSLKIKKCASLDTIPFGPVMFVTLVENPALKHWSGENYGFAIDSDDGRQRAIVPWTWKLIEMKITKCPELDALPTNLSPQKLEISECRSLSALPDECHAARLHLLALDACHDKTLVASIPSTSSLTFLVISNISKLICLPKWPSLPSLSSLHIRGCENLKYLSNQEDKFQGFTSLKVLSIKDCPKLVTLPLEGLPTSLEYLSIVSCARLWSYGPPDVLKKLTSLNDLYIEDCPKLQSLPENGLSTSLHHLSIQQCPSLIERCGKQEGDLPKIKDIPNREIETPSTGTPASSSSTPWNRLLKCLRGK